MLTLIGNKLTVGPTGRHDCDDNYLYSAPSTSCQVQAYAFDGVNFNPVGSPATLNGTAAGGSFFNPMIYHRNGFVFGHAGGASGCLVKIRLYKYLFTGTNFVQQAIFTDTYATGNNFATACFDTNGTYIAYIVNNSNGGNHIYILDFNLNLLYTAIMSASRVTIDSRNIVYVGSNAYQFNGTSLSLIGATPEPIIDTDGDKLFSENKAYSGTFTVEASVPSGTIRYYDRFKNKVISLDGSNNTYIYNYEVESFTLVDQGNSVGVGFGSQSYYFLKYGTDIGAYTAGTSAPIADFTADITTGNPNLTVNFTDLSTESPTSWEWDFGDGSPHDFTQNPTHVYAVSGMYTVTLYVSNTGGSDIKSKPNYIIVGWDRYWVASSTRNWDATSWWSMISGGAGGAPIPNSMNTVYFDANGPGDCILDVPVEILGLRFEQGYSGMFLQGSKSLIVGTNDASFCGGCFLGGTAPITVNGSVNIDGAEFWSTSETFTIEGDFVYTSDTSGDIIPSKIMMEEITLTAEDATNKYVFLTDVPTKADFVVLNIVGGGPQHYGTDFTTSANLLSWSGMALDGNLSTGDTLRILYECIPHYPGTFVHNNGTVLLKANDTLFQGNGIRFNTLKVRYDGTDTGSLTIDTSSYVENLLALESGYFIHGSDATVHVEKDLTCSPRFGSVQDYQVVIDFDGTGRQNFRYAGGILPTVIVDKQDTEHVMTSGTGPVLIKGNFYIVDGTFNCGGLDVVVGGSAVV